MEVLCTFDVMKELGFKMNVLFGGEPMLRPDILDIIRYATKIELPYAFISNSSFITQQSIRDLIDAGLDNYTASVDTLDSKDQRSHDGIRSLLAMKEAGVRDIVANIVIHKNNVEEIPSIVSFFTLHGIWSILGVIQDCEQDSGWDYRSANGLGLKHASRDKVESLKRILISGYGTKYKIHNVLSYIENINTFGVDLNWKCSTPSYIPIDEDGTLMTCVDKRGVEVGLKKYILSDLLNLKTKEQYFTDRAVDVAKCSGCYYNHSWQVENLGGFDLAHR